MSLPRIASYEPPSELPEARVPWRIEPDRCALLVHDMQRYFLGAYEQGAEPLRTVVPNIARLCARARERGIPVYYSAQPGDQEPEDRGIQTDFWGTGMRGIPEHRDIIEELTPRAGDRILTKWRYSAFQRTALREWLTMEGRDQLIVTGVYAHLGCMMTACEAYMSDVQPFLVADAVADFSAEEHRMAVGYVARRCGVAVRTGAALDAFALCLSGR
ncbi:isochorismatase family protein [Sciscionella marina]|uniref:isochorismatase family protein n=1 Tax=Sciscionella marina TaxID=508770 RepID=UPI000368E417|nr:isochorismatase family protein [Sciscionella marina]